MNLEFLKKVFKVLGKITDILLKGREVSLWEKDSNPDFKPKDKIQ